LHCNSSSEKTDPDILGADQQPRLSRCQRFEGGLHAYKGRCGDKDGSDEDKDDGGKEQDKIMIPPPCTDHTYMDWG
jgi:hypothetical protein